MKILIVGPTFYPDVNGASYFTQRLAQYLCKEGHSILVIAPSRFMQNENYDLNGVSVFGIRSFPTFINGFRVAQMVFIKRIIRGEIKRFSPDVIHLQSHLVFSKAVVEIAEELQVPVIGTNHFMPENLIHYLHLPRKIENYITRRMWNHFLKIFEKIDVVTTPTETGAKLLAEIGLTKAVRPISCGIDLKIFHPKNDGNYLKKKYNLSEKPILLYLGRLDKEKNVNVLLKAFALTLKKIDAHFIIAGFGGEEINLRKLASGLNIGKSVTFTGFVTDKDKPNLYKIADCFAIAGIAELQSIVTMEAMASGLPVIAVNAMALPHLVKHGENGFLFQLNSIESISEYIVNIFSDNKLKSRMSKRSLEIIKDHDVDRVVKKYESLYQEVINRRTQNTVFSSHKKTCFILLPGFSPDHVPILALKRALEKRGYAVIGSSFFGDMAVEDFQKITIQQCHENISSIINRAALGYDRVIGVGVSLGGALLLEHAKTKNHLYGIVSIGTPFKLRYRRLMRVGEFLLPIAYPIWKRFEKLKHLRLLPIGAGPAVIRYLENEFLQKLENVQVPILFIHGKKDIMTDYRLVPEFSEKVSSKHKEVILSENGDHVIDYDPEFISDQLLRFFDLR